MRLEVKIKNLELKNPIICASGTLGYAQEVSGFLDINKLGGVVTKTITLNPRSGNPHPRIYDLGWGVVNSVGLENPGLKAFKERYGQFLSSLKTKVFVSVYAYNIREWQALVENLQEKYISGIELNLSCPNIKKEILAYHPSRVFKLISKLRKLTKKTLIAKLSYCPQILDVALSAQDAGIDALTLINTLPAMVCDFKRCTPILGNIFGGLSGPCIKPLALKCVYEVSHKVKIPVIGCGGIISYKDVLEFLCCGAEAVQVGTAVLKDFRTPLKILEDLERYAKM